MNDDKDDDETVPDIFQIVKSYLEDIKKLNVPALRKAKMVMHLTAGTQYVQLRDSSATIQIAYSPVSMPVWLLPAAW